MNSSLLMFYLPGFCCENSSISWLLPYIIGAIPQSYMRGCNPSWSPQKVHQIKYNSQHLDCAFFFFWSQVLIDRLPGGWRWTPTPWLWLLSLETCTGTAHHKIYTLSWNVKHRLTTYKDCPLSVDSNTYPSLDLPLLLLHRSCHSFCHELQPQIPTTESL